MVSAFPDIVKDCPKIKIYVRSFENVGHWFTIVSLYVCWSR